MLWAADSSRATADIVSTRPRQSTHGTAYLCVLVLALGSCRMRPSSVPLGGSHEVEASVRPRSLPAAAASVPSVEEDKAAAQAEQVEVTAITPLAPAAALLDANAKPAPPGAFQVKPYVASQIWTRLFDLEFHLKVGPGGGIDMKMTSHQECRFEVLAASNGAIDKLGIEYTVYTSTLSMMGASQDSPEELAGKRFVITFNNGKPDVRDASGGTPPKKQVDSVKDDAREPLEIEKALKELAQLTAKGVGDFSMPGAVALAGGEDEDTKVSRAKASLQRLTSGARGDKLALLELGYTLTSVIDDKSSIEVQVAGNMSVLDGPSRYGTSTLQGPMELRSSEPGGMAGRGTIRVVTSYKY